MAAELKEIEEIGKTWAKQIKAKGDKAAYQSDKTGYLTGAKVSLGELVEAAGVEEVAAHAKGLTVIRNAAIQFVDAAGKNVRGRQAELDFLVLGTATGVDIISAKFKPKQFRPAVDRRHLNHYLTMPFSPPGVVTYAQSNFGTNKAYVNIAGVKVTHSAGSDDLANFRATHLSKVTVSTVNVVPLTPAPSAPTGIQLVATESELIAAVVVVIDKNI